MLGQMQLNVLRRLRDEGVIREKLHLAVNGLLTEGYVNQDDGYMLTEKGAAVIYLYDNLTDNERELLMRMHRAFKEKRTFLRDEDSANVAGGLMQAGLVEGDKTRLVLTLYAADAWDGWVNFWDMKHKRHEETRRNKIRALAATKPVIEKALSDAPRSGVAGNGVTTDKLPMPHELPTVRPFVEDLTPTPPVDDEAVDALEHCDTCAGCVDHEILHMLTQKFPAIARLRQSVLETRRLMSELGIEPK